jgi:hypothetical protein
MVLCQRFQCTPSQLMEEDAPTAFHSIALTTPKTDELED